MKKIISGLVSVMVAGMAFNTSAYAGEGMSEAHAHIGHVMTSWNDTPSQHGLLPVAMKDAGIAAAHAALAAKSPNDLAAMKLHARHVHHAIDSSYEASGPGTGYGLIKAANGGIGHATLASKSKGASDAVKVHTEHAVTSLNNAIARSRMALYEAQAVLIATSAGQAAAHAAKMAELTQAVVNGVDANGDGGISWHAHEGGLNVASQHMGIMMDAEGMKH